MRRSLNAQHEELGRSHAAALVEIRTLQEQREEVRKHWEEDVQRRSVEWEHQRALLLQVGVCRGLTLLAT